MHKGGNELKEALKQGRGLLVTVFIFSLFVNLLMLTSPIFMLSIFDRVMSSRSQETLLALFMLVVTLIALRGLLDYARKRLMARFGAQFQESLEKFVIADSVASNSGGKTNPALSDLDNVRSFFNSYALMSIFDLIWVPVFLGVVFIFHSLLGWVATIGVALLVILNILKLTLSRGQADRARSASRQVKRHTDVVKSLKDVLLSHGMTNSVKNKWLSARNNSRDRAIEHNDTLTSYTVISSHLRSILQTAILALGAYLVLEGEITIGAMIAANFLLFRVFSPVEQFLKQWQRITRTVHHWRSLRESFDSAKSNSVQQVKKLNASKKTTLRLIDVSVDNPGTGEEFLSDMSLSLLPGKRINVAGDSGSGKTTLARALIGLLPASRGVIRLGGTNIDECPADLVMRHIGYLPQQARFVPGTIEENIAKMARKIDRNKVLSAARIAKTHEIIERLPKGYRTNIDESANQLSHGERQRISLARAFYGMPKILILDAPDEDILGVLDEQTLADASCSLIVFSRKYLIGHDFDCLYRLQDGQLTLPDSGFNEPVVHIRSKR